ncbi:unnamed protein product [Effrenium voratum]|nr:unnamed protein product [Effrenium voratum]
MLALLFFAVTRPALAWTRLTVVHSEKCEESGCQVAAKCPEKTWPVACESEPRGHAWFNQGSCTASARLDIEIRAKVACTSMFETFTVSGPTARCPAGSQLQRCFCQDRALALLEGLPGRCAAAARGSRLQRARRAPGGGRSCTTRPSFVPEGR